MKMELTDKSGRKSGNITIFIILDHAVNINISKIVCKIENVEMFGKNDHT